MSHGEFYTDTSTETIVPNQFDGLDTVNNTGKSIRNRIFLLLGGISISIAGWNMLPPEKRESIFEKLETSLASVHSIPGVEHIGFRGN